MRNASDMSLIDPEIQGLVKELNKQGYKTTSSCAGHPGSPEFAGGEPTKGNGYVIIKGQVPVYPFERTMFLSKLLPVFEKRGCKNISWFNSTVHDSNGREFSVDFDPIGQPWAKWKARRPEGFWGKYYLPQKQGGKAD